MNNEEPWDTSVGKIIEVTEDDKLIIEKRYPQIHFYRQPSFNEVYNKERFFPHLLKDENE